MKLVSTHMPLARHDASPREKSERRERFLLTCLLRGMTIRKGVNINSQRVSTHMPLARHDAEGFVRIGYLLVSTHMPLARHDSGRLQRWYYSKKVSTHMPLARHDAMSRCAPSNLLCSFYSHASCEA